MKTKEQLGGIYSASITAYDATGAIDAAAPPPAPSVTRPGWPPTTDGWSSICPRGMTSAFPPAASRC